MKNMDNDGSRDRWLIDGDCELCRRQAHCNKPCKLARQAQQVQLVTAMTHAVARTLLGAKEGNAA